MRWSSILVVTMMAVLGGCGSSSPAISADTRCADYLQHPAPERHDAATRISAEIEGVSSPGNPMWGLSLDGACGSSPSLTLGEYFSHAN